MRTIRWDDGTRYDDPNARWGSPAYVLEPGDPGYVDPNPSPNPSPLKPKTKPKHMSSNATPVNRTILTALARNILAGQLSLGATVGLHHHTSTQMDAAIKKLGGDPAADPGTDENQGSQLRYRDCIDSTSDARAALATYSDGPVKAWLSGYRKVLTGVHGSKSNDGWIAAGFPPGTTSVPRSHDARHGLLDAARAYLVTHDTYEASLPQAGGSPLAVTAAEALALSTAMQVAKTLINDREAEQATCKMMRDTDVDALFDEVSSTISELSDLLSVDDPRWENFGLNIPAHPNPPGGVASLTLTAAGTGRELAVWPYAVRADYYRLYLKRVGTDEDFVNVADPKDLEYTLKDLTPGDTIEVYVLPMNSGGTGSASPTVSKVVGV